MKIDQTHQPWAIGTASVFAVAAVGYAAYAKLAVNGPEGGSAVGLLFGVLGYGLMLFATLLSLRKKFPVWRIGRAKTWMRGHLWLGLLSYPMILFHAGFSSGGRLTTTLLWLMTFVIVSGLLGAALQHFMPQLITQRVPMETIYDQINSVQSQLLAEADKLVGNFVETAAKLGVTVAAAAANDGSTALATSTTAHNPAEEFQSVYAESIRPFLATRGMYDHPLYARKNAKGMFLRLRKLVPSALHEIIEDLEDICEEKRDLDRQSRMHRILHGWLFVHVPLSYALMVLGTIHAILALRY